MARESVSRKANVYCTKFEESIINNSNDVFKKEELQSQDFKDGINYWKKSFVNLISKQEKLKKDVSLIFIDQTEHKNIEPILKIISENKYLSKTKVLLYVNGNISFDNIIANNKFDVIEHEFIKFLGKGKEMKHF